MRRILSRVYVVLILNMIINSISGQDLHYADIQSMNLWYNQSLKLDKRADIRLNYRDIKYQSLLAFRTGSAMLNIPISRKKEEADTEEKGYLNLTLGGAYDKSNKGIFKNTYGLVGISYTQPLSGDRMYISAGFQGGSARSVLSTTGVYFQDQFDQYGPLPSVSRDPLRLGRNYNWYSLNAGLSVFQNTEAKEWYLGASLRHLNRPFTDEMKTTIYRLAPTAGLQGGFTVKNNSDAFGIYWISNFKAKAHEHLIGIKAQKQLSNEQEKDATAVGVGIAIRMQDAVIPNLQLRFGKTNIGLHYDVNISGLRATGFTRQGFELAITRIL